MNNLTSNLKQHWPTIGISLLIILLILLKWDKLDLPFFWDEAWVYGPAIQIMAENGASLLPHSIPESYSRGHPLLFHFLGGLWLQIFGSSLTAAHTFALIISCLLLWSIYYFGATLFSKSVGILSASLLFTNSVFLTQSTMVLPEVLMALLALWTIFFYLKQKWLWYVIFGVAMVWTKESGLAVIASLLFGHFAYRLISKRKPFLAGIQGRQLIVIVIPFLFYIIHLLLCKWNLGWYLYPEHKDMVGINTFEITNRIHLIAKILFESRGQYIMTMALGVTLIAFWHKTSNFRWGQLIIIAASLLFYYQIPARDQSTIFYIFNLLCLSLSLYLIGRYLMQQFPLQRKSIGILGMVSIGYVLFCTLNFFTTRYIVMLLPIFCLLTILLIEGLTIQKPIFKLVIYIGMLTFTYQQNFPYKSANDDNYGMYYAIEVAQKAVHFLEEEAHYSANISSNFLMSKNLRDPLCGYLENDRPFKNVKFEFDKNTNYHIDYSADPHSQTSNLLKEGKIELDKEWVIKNAWVRIYIPATQ